MLRKLVGASALLLAFSCGDDDAGDGGGGNANGGAAASGGMPAGSNNAGSAEHAGAVSDFAGAPSFAGVPGTSGQPALGAGGASAGQGGVGQSGAGEGGEAPIGGVGSNAGSSNAGSSSGGAPASGEGGAAGSRAAGAGGEGGALEPPPPSLPCNIVAILAARCTTCHQDPPVNLAPMSLLAYDDVVTYSLAMQAVIQEGVMPPRGAPQLSDDQATTLVDYLSLGAPPSGKGPCP